MADISYIFGGAFEPPMRQYIEPPEQQLRQAMIDAGLQAPDIIVLDGKLHRFNSNTKGGAGASDKAGWYIAFNDGVPAGRFGCWRAGIEVSWRANIGRQLSSAEELDNINRQSEARALRDAELERARDIAEDTVNIIWSNAQAASPEHPYLLRKGIGTHGARVTGDGRLVVPLYSEDGTLSSLQYISHDGTKLYHSGGATGGKFWQVGTNDTPGVVYIAEGFATAATIHEASGRLVVVAYSASNLVPVAGIIREIYGQDQDIIIVADNDKSGVGQRYAEQACAKHGVTMVIPEYEGDANDYVKSGHDLMALLNPPKNEWLIKADDFSKQPAPINWLVKDWIQDNALVMVHGQSGGGKTFVVLDWCLRIASDMNEWIGKKVKNGNVIYLAGEGHHGLRGRIAAWKHFNQVPSVNMWLSKDGCDLNTNSGYSKVIESIRQIKVTPMVIVVDTLHRFLAGDENSAQDAKTMLDACSALMREFNCTVILVHHTGVSDDSQHRARGSSAWRGALDIEISIIPSVDGAPIQIVQRKSKDAELAEPVNVELFKVNIPGWFDEDNQPVSSAVIAESSAPPAPVKTTKHDENFRTFERAWWASNAEEREGLPYLSRSALRDMLVSDGASERTARNKTEATRQGSIIEQLLNAGIISTYEHGWIVINTTQASALLVRKNER